FRNVIALDPKSAQAQNILGILLQDKGQVDEAIACWKQAIALNPRYVQPHYNLGIALANKGEADGAIACFRNVIALDPKSAQAQNILGILLQDKGQVDEAIACFRKALALDPKDANARGHLAKAERLAAARDKFAAFQNGTYTPATPSERLDLVEWRRVKKLHHTAAGLYAAAFAADPRLADDLKAAHRYNAACHAALAAAGQG